MALIAQFHLDVKPTSTGSISATVTQTMTGQVDVGFGAVPYGLDMAADGRIRIIASGNDVAALRTRSGRVNLTNVATLESRKDVLRRFSQAPEPRLVTVADGVHAWIGAGGDSNAGAIETPEGLLIVDAQQYPRLGRALREAALERTGQPLRLVINTHCHLDHTHGNVVFADVPILAHETTLAAMNAC